MANYNTDDHKVDRPDQRYNTEQRGDTTQAVVSNSGNYRIYPKENSDGDARIYISRINNKQIPPKHQEFLESFVNRRGFWVATLVPSDHSKYTIGLLEWAIKTESYVEVVNEIVEEL